MKRIAVFLIVCIFFSLINLSKAETVLVFPKDSQLFYNLSAVTFVWNSLPESPESRFNIQVAYDSIFTNIVISTSTLNSTYTFTPPTWNTYYIRTKHDNEIWSRYLSIKFIRIDTISQIIAWQSADSLVTVSANKVSAWTDLVNGARSVTQTVPNNQPDYIASVPLLNNKPVLSFNGLANPSYLNINPAIEPNNFSLYMLRNRKANSTLIQTFMGNSSGGGLYSDFTQASIGYGIFIPPINNTTPVSALKNDYSIYLNTNKNLYRNNVLDASGTSIPSISINAIGTRLDNPSFSYFGEIAEYIFFNKILDSTNNNAVYNYFRAKYTSPVNLGKDTVFGTSFCDTLRLNAGNRFLSYLWSTGETTPSIKVTANNTYSVKVKDIFGYESRDDIYVLPYKPLANKKIYLCKGDTLKLDLKLPVGFTAQWSNGVNSTKINLTQSGKYSVLITDSRSCTFRDTIELLINQTSYSPNIINKQLTLCEGEKLFFLSNIPLDSIRWSTGSTQNSTTFLTNDNYFVSSTTINGCLNKDTISITIAGKAPTVKFDFTPTCIATAINFTDSTIVPSGNTIQSWKWNFSNNTSSTSQNTSVTFPAAGLASAALKVTTNAGCTDSIYKTFTINKKPTPSFYNLLSCEGMPTIFADQTIANAAAVTDWSWNFGGLGISNGMQNPGFSFPAAGNYLVTLKATNSNGCSDTISRQVAVNSSPNANFSFDSVCGKTPVNLKFLATVQAPSVIPDINWGSWDFGDGTIETAIRNPQHIYNEPGTYDVKLVVKSSNQCLDTVVKQIKVFDFPVVDFTISPTQCVGKSIQFTDISATPDGTPISKWNWYFSGLATDTIQHPKYTFNSQGNYTIQLTAQNTVGCSNTKLRSIAVSSPPIPKFTFSPQNGLPPLNVNYVNQSATNGNYLWNYGDGGPFIAGYNPPPHVYTAIGTYPIKLVATDFRGCTDTLTKFILVDRAYLDGVMASISLIPTSGDFYKVQVSIINNSNVEITALGLSLQLGGGAEIRENWTGSLLPGQTTVYLFNGELRAGDNSIPVVCASIDNVNNNATENRTDNNTTCKEIKVGGFDILTIFPNPAYDNNINFGVMLPAAGKVNIRFVDVLGQQMYQSDFDGIKGYNQFAMPIGMLNATVYVAEVSFDGEVVRKKFMRKNR